MVACFISHEAVNEGCIIWSIGPVQMFDFWPDLSRSKAARSVFCSEAGLTCSGPSEWNCLALCVYTECVGFSRGSICLTIDRVVTTTKKGLRLGPTIKVVWMIVEQPSCQTRHSRVDVYNHFTVAQNLSIKCENLEALEHIFIHFHMFP